MAVPSDLALIVTDPQPLNPAGFPYTVIAFPGEYLLTDGDFNVPADKRTPVAGDPVNFEPGQH